VNQLQRKLYELLIDLDKICSDHGVTYYLAAGGALGAIRHGGFLPWDDDLDVYITRDNWEKFKQVVDDALPSNRTFICEENNKLYCNSVGRFVDKDSTLMMPSHLLCGDCCGLQIEFFIMDPFPVEPKAQLEHSKNLKAFTELLLPYFVLNKNIFSRNADFDYKLYNKYYFKSKIFGREKVLAELKQKITSVPEEECRSYCMRWGQKTWVFPKSAFQGHRTEMFEGRLFPIVNGSETIFRIGYGDDWMYVPTKENQITHDLSNDINEPFKTYTDIYMPLIDREKLMKSYKKRKRVDMKCLVRREQYERETAVLRADICGKTIAEEGYDIAYMRKLLAEGKFRKLDDILQRFYTASDNPLVKDNQVMIPVEDDYLYVAVMNKVKQGFYFNGSKLISLREKNGKPLTEELNDAKAQIEFCRAVSIAIYDEKDIYKVEELLKENEQYSSTIDYKRAELWVMKHQAETDTDHFQLLSKAEEYLSYFPEDGEIMRFEAYAAYKLCKLELAEEKYRNAVACTRNGFVWREAKELFGIDNNNR